ncbi:MAG TPA: hypothetical protein VIF62_18295 [Labilithrix sp.]|jgi:hypothetical protein
MKWNDMTAPSIAGGVALLVGLGGRLQVLCAGTALEAGMRTVAVASAAEAIERMFAKPPRVVIAPIMLDAHELARLTSAAAETGAELVLLPNIVTIDRVAHDLATALARSEPRSPDSEPPPTLRSHARLRV